MFEVHRHADDQQEIAHCESDCYQGDSILAASTGPIYGMSTATCWGVNV